MNRIHQGRANKMEILDLANQRLTVSHEPSAIGHLPLVIRRRQGGLCNSVAKYLPPGNDQPTPEECFHNAGCRLEAQTT